MSTKLELNFRINEIGNAMEDGRPRQEIMKEYAGKWNVSERTIERYMFFAVDILQHRIARQDALMDAMRSEYIAECMEKIMRSTIELEARLCAIAEGEVEIEKTVHTKEGVVKVMQKPNHSHMLRAIDRVLKMRGCYDTRERIPLESFTDLKTERDLKKEKDFSTIAHIEDMIRYRNPISQ